MKCTGIVRRIDSLGRLVLPKEIRDAMDINEAPIEILIDNDTIVLRKYQPSCVFCGSFDNVEQYKGKLVCEECRKELAKTLN